MAAPALVALASGFDDPRATSTVSAIVEEVRAVRPDLRVESAYVDAPLKRRGSVASVCDALAKAGHDEIVLVPLLLTESPEAAATVAGAVSTMQERHDSLRVQATPALGLEACFLQVLDSRLREALRTARVRELDALVLAAVGSTDAISNQAVARLARVWGAHHKLPVTTAYAQAAPPAAGEAVRAFRAEGRRHIAVASFFLTPGPLADRAAELALEAGAAAVAEPLGAHPEVARTVLARYAVGAVELVPV
ncbi:sirohydrochlorin chelatase [Nocardioides bruguierae]|uniref:sirohydrochlorin chelatase n=1 Tax=Nocardioides bruguierae TaxID=2945102 RepID=UPI00254736F0|nr:CbiX/SirB N-terminal domain-containing protein [Nocardioides bruguierae]